MNNQKSFLETHYSSDQWKSSFPTQLPHMRDKLQHVPCTEGDYKVLRV